jgi:CelD/BcsL family acetyltransferase involved in cellulose biosynthesis
MRARVFEGSSLVDTLSDNWDDLFSLVPQASYALSRPWQSSFILSGRLSGRPLAITTWSGERLVSLLTLDMRRRAGLRVAQPVGTGSPGHIGLLADPKCAEHAAEVTAAACLEQRLFDVLALHDLASDDDATQHFVQTMARRGLTVQRVPRTVCRRARLCGTIDDFLAAHKSAKSRQTLRRKERQLDRAGAVRIEYLRGAEVTSTVLERITRVRAASWMKRRGAQLLDSAFERDCLRRLAEAGMLRVWFLNLAGDDAACVVATVTNGLLEYRYPAFKLAYEHLSVGQVLLQHSIADACREGVSVYDFGHGDADYKRFWANDCHHIERAFIGRGLLGAAAATGLAFAWRAVRHGRLRRALKAVLRKSSPANENPDRETTCGTG